MFKHKAPYNAIDIANFFIAKGMEEGEPISNLKLQKLVYIAYGYYTVFFEGQVLFEDRIEAWNYGPVIPEVYHTFKIYGPYIIEKTTNNDYKKIDAETAEFLSAIYYKYVAYSPSQLVMLTHRRGTPWETTLYSIGATIDRPIRGVPIKPETIQEYYKHLMQQTITANA